MAKKMVFRLPRAACTQMWMGKRTQRLLCLPRALVRLSVVRARL